MPSLSSGSLPPRTGTGPHTSRGLHEADTVPVDLEALGRRRPTLAIAVATLRQALEQAQARHAPHVHLEPSGGRWRLRHRHDDGLDETLLEERAALPQALLALHAHLTNATPPARPLDTAFTLRFGDGVQLVSLQAWPTADGLTTQLTLHGRLLGPPRLDELGADPARVTALRDVLARSRTGWLPVGVSDEPGGVALIHAIAQELASPDRKLLCIEPRWRVSLARVTPLERTFAAGAVATLDADAVLLATAPSDDVLRALAARATHDLLVVDHCTARRPSEIARRLLALGLTPAWLALALPAIVMRYRVRRLCPVCRVTVSAVGAAGNHRHAAVVDAPDPDDIAGWLARSLRPRARRGDGCAQCRGTGHDGVHDVLDVTPLDDTVRRTLRSGDLETAFARLDVGHYLASRLASFVADGDIDDAEARRHLAPRY